MTAEHQRVTKPKRPESPKSRTVQTKYNANICLKFALEIKFEDVVPKKNKSQVDIHVYRSLSLLVCKDLNPGRYHGLHRLNDIKCLLFCVANLTTVLTKFGNFPTQ